MYCLSLLLADRGMMGDGVIDLPALVELVADAGYRDLVAAARNCRLE